jgi:multiple sugar transport system substrate-binding protein
MTKRTTFQRYHELAASRRTILKAGASAAAATAMAPFAVRLASSQDSAVTIRYWNWWDVGRTALMDEIIAGFQEEFPTITVENIPQTWERRDELVVTALAGGDPPEVLMATRQEIVKFADSGAIVPIDAYVEAEGIDLSAYYESEIASMWWEDQLYALPMPTAGGETGLYFYNTRLFEEAGLDPETPPETWDDLDAATAALTVLSSDGAIEQMGVNLGVTHLAFLSQLYCNNGSLYSDDLRTVTFNSAEGIETLQWMLDFVKRHYGSQQAVLDWENAIQEGEDRFHQERLAVQFQNVSQFFHIKNNVPDLPYSVHFRPYNGNNPDAKSQGVAAMSFGWGYIIPVGLDPAVEEAAFTFVKRITYDEAGACWFMVQQERPSPLIACNESPEYAEINPHWAKVQQVLENDISVGVVPVQGEIFSTLMDYVDLVGFEEMSPEEGLNTAAEEAQGILDEFWASSS